jgi:phosphohistidine phosphatase
MKNLFIMRHAKSDWGNSSLSDFDRPLNDRGKKSAPLMGKELLIRNKIPELIISSPANRAKTTAKMVAESCGYKGEIIFDQEFYFGTLDGIIDEIKKKGSNAQSIMVVGHNPTWESLVYRLSKSGSSIQMPTAAIASIAFEIDSWKELEPKSGYLEFLIIPKDINAQL